MDVLNETWEEYIKDLEILTEKVKKSNANFDFIIGIPRGGLIPATYISHQLEIPLIVDDIYTLITPIKLLVIDDISDTGHTLERYKKNNVTIATLHIKTGTEVIPDFYVREFPKTTWIKYPYEKEEDKWHTKKR